MERMEVSITTDMSEGINGLAEREPKRLEEETTRDMTGLNEKTLDRFASLKSSLLESKPESMTNCHLGVRLAVSLLQPNLIILSLSTLYHIMPPGAGAGSAPGGVAGYQPNQGVYQGNQKQPFQHP